MTAKAIIQRLQEHLTPLGFGRRGSTWNRTHGSFVDVVEVQNDKSGGMVTIEAGVLHVEAYRKFSGTEVPSTVQGPLCIVRARLGQLLDGMDHWYDSSETRTADVLIEKIDQDVLPFLSRMHSLEAMAQFLEGTDVAKLKYPPPIIYLAIIANELGDKPGACMQLVRIREMTTAAWKVRVAEIAARLGC